MQPTATPPKPLETRVVWVTGSARRVGRAIAVACARAGARIIVHYRTSRADADATLRLVEAEGSSGIALQADQLDDTAVCALVREVENRFGRLDALVNNASTFERTPLEELRGDQFLRILDENLGGPYRCIDAALPLLRRADPGHIVNITDWAVASAYRGYAAYHAAKTGLDGLTRALARELAPGVRVNAVAPGAVLAPEDLTDQTREAILRRIPLGAWGHPEDVASAVVFLLCSDYLTGVTLPVDGGRRLG